MSLPKKQNPAIDEQWFKDTIADNNLTVRGIAKIMGLHPSTVSLMIRGYRNIQHDDAVKLADLLRVPVVEIFRRAGAPIKDEQRKIKVMAFVDGHGEYHAIDVSVADSFVAPYDAPTNSYGLQIRSGGRYDGWMLVVAGAKKDPQDCIGRFCVYCMDDGDMKLGMLRRGYKEGTYNTTHDMCNGSNVEGHQNVKIVWCQEVIWIKPAY